MERADKKHTKVTDKIFHAVANRYIEAHLTREWYRAEYLKAIRQYWKFIAQHPEYS